MEQHHGIGEKGTHMDDHHGDGNVCEKGAHGDSPLEDIFGEVLYVAPGELLGIDGPPDPKAEVCFQDTSQHRADADRGLGDAARLARAKTVSFGSADVERAMTKRFKFAMRNLHYNPNRPIHALFAFRGTAIEMVVARADFWLFLSLNIMFNLVYGLSGGLAVQEKPITKGWPKLTYVALGASGGLITFFLVFYNSSAYTRFYQLYGLVRSAETAIERLILSVRVTFHDGACSNAEDTRCTVIRCMVAAHALALANLKPFRAAGVLDWTLGFLAKYHTLSAEEISSLKALPPRVLCFEELVERVCHLLWAHVRVTNVIPPPVFGPVFMAPITQFKAAFETLEQQLEYPIPFAYFHLLNLVTVLYLLIASYAFVFLTPYWSIIPYIILLFSFLGLRELSCALADPFGNDATDLPAFRYVVHLHQKYLGTLDKASFAIDMENMGWSSQ